MVPRSAARAMIRSSTSVMLLHERHPVAEPPQVPADGVERDRGAAVPEVRHVVRRRPAHVHRDRAFLSRHEVDLRARGGVVDAKHASTVIAAAGRSGLVLAAAAASPVREERDRPDRDAFGPADRAETFGALGLHRHDDPGAHRLARRRERARPTGRPSRPMCGASFGVSAATATSTLSTHQPSLRHPCRDLAAAVRASRRPGRLSSDAGNSVPRSGSPAAPSRASAIGVRDRVAVGVARQSRRLGDLHATEHERRRIAERDGRRSPCRSGTSPVGPGVEQGLGQFEVAGDGQLQVARLARHDGDGTAAGLDERGVVGLDRHRRDARRAARRRGTPAASARGRDRHAARSRRRARRRPASPCRPPEARGSRRRRRRATAAITDANSDARRERPGGVVHDDDVGIGGHEREAGPYGVGARRAARRGSARLSGALPLRVVGRRRPRRPSHAARASPRPRGRAR